MSGDRKLMQPSSATAHGSTNPATTAQPTGHMSTALSHRRTPHRLRDRAWLENQRFHRYISTTGPYYSPQSHEPGTGNLPSSPSIQKPRTRATDRSLCHQNPAAYPSVPSATITTSPHHHITTSPAAKSRARYEQYFLLLECMRLSVRHFHAPHPEKNYWFFP